ncbi:MAG: glycosyltransferase family 2 protein [Anaerolineales bacterium]|nr:glycosyltransferase family 2 protein [Anaerolineales bacterium]
MTDLRQVSVIIPTYNRASYLQICLNALAALRTDPAIFEIVIVDNNSTDNTQSLVLAFAQAHPDLGVHYLLETNQGLSYARNRAVREANGEFLCFLDDDAPPSPEWLNIILKGFCDPSVGCIGGPALLDYQGQERPPWLKGDLQGLLSGYELPYNKPAVISKVAEFPFGCNMAFRKKVFSEVGLFRTNLDRCGDQVLAAGDTEMIGRVHKAGWKVLYLPQAQVRHLVAPERLKKEYIYRIGKGLATTHILLTADPRPHMILRWFASDLWYTSQMLWGFLIALILRKPLWFDDYMRLWMVASRIPFRFKMLFRGMSTPSQRQSKVVIGE